MVYTLSDDRKQGLLNRLIMVLATPFLLVLTKENT